MAPIRTFNSIYFLTLASDAIVFFNPFSPSTSTKNFKPQLHLAHSHIRLGTQLAFSPCPVTVHYPHDDKIISLCKKNLHREALQAFDIFRKCSSSPLKSITYTHLINACSSLRSLEHGRKIHRHMLTCNYQPDMILQNHILSMYGKCGSLKEARNIFDAMPLKNVVSWTSMISGYSRYGQEDNAITLYIQMLRSGYIPDHFTFGSIVKSCSGLDDFMLARQLHAHVLKFEFGGHLIAQNALISMYTKFSQMADAINVFSRIIIKDLISWGSMIAGFSQLGYELEALCHFREMLSQSVYQPNEFVFACLQQNQAGEVLRLTKLMFASRIMPDHVTLTNVLVSSGQIASYEVGSQIHCFIMKSGLNLDTSVSNALINMYTKCGSLECARKMFDSIGNPDIISWSSLIVGYAQAGCGKEAFELFRTMRGLGVKPNEITFLGILTACSHIGMVEEGLKLYRTMQEDCRISPTKEHCSCIVDLLARAGCLDVAEEFIKQMPFVPDVVVWKTLLAACKVHGNLEVGKRAAENVLKIDPSNSAAVVMLCNIHASSGHWKDLAQLRISMRRMDVGKVPGQSWIEIKDKVHVFLAEDNLHPERGKIYTMLEELMLQTLDDSCDPLQMVS
uniref:Pentatricopeptide repeat-containing protein At3g53360, mitochondrial n=1 Tax=Cucumis melo TaxID=3656 RepID=A0A9I9CW78_CUCME